MHSDEALHDELLRQRAFLRALAQRLLRDDARAEDVVQETLVLALERRPVVGGSLRGWLAGALRHLAWKDARAEGRRAARERAAARPEQVGGDVDAELEAGARLYAALGRLEEPFRTALVLRYGRELAPAEIARVLGVPLATVKSRLRRGLARLRAELGAEPGGRRALALLAAARPRAPLTSVTVPQALGGLAMTAKVLKVAGVAAGVVLALLAWRAVGAVGPAPDARLAEPAAPEVAGPAERALSDELSSSGGAQRVAEGAGAEQAAAPTSPGHGLVLDLHGRPVPFVAVERGRIAGGKGDRAETDGAGRFPLQVGAGEWEYRVETERWTSLAVGRESAGIETPLVVVAPAALYAGRVVDHAGEAVAGALVRQTRMVGQDWTAAFERSLEGSDTCTHFTRTDALGRFELRAPVLPGEGLMASAPEGWPRVVVEAPGVTTRGMELALPAPPEPLRPVAGVVRDPEGAPVAGATVQLGSSVQRTDELGRFELDGAGPEPDAPLRVVAEGFRSLELPELRRAPGWPLELVLELPGPALALEGRVLDERGHPLAGRRVHLVDPTPFGMDTGLRYASVEQLASGQPFTETASDAEGRFRLAGLEEREYTLAAEDPATLRVAWASARAGASGVELAFADEPRAAIAGRVRAPDGSALAGVEVLPARPVAHRIGTGLARRTTGAGLPTGEDARHALLLEVEGVLTDSEGRFALPPLPLGVDRLSLRGPEVVPTTRFLAGGAVREELELEVPRRARLRVELGPRWEHVGGFRLVDAEGAEVRLWTFEADSWGDQGEGFFTGGRSPIYAVPEGSAAELVLLDGGGEWHRAPLSVPAGGPTTVRID